nr:PREDICTED: retinal guanylyl cyclase 1 [Lepisosteus oculatus]
MAVQPDGLWSFLLTSSYHPRWSQTVDTARTRNRIGNAGGNGGAGLDAMGCSRGRSWSWGKWLWLPLLVASCLLSQGRAATYKIAVVGPWTCDPLFATALPDVAARLAIGRINKDPFLNKGYWYDYVLVNEDCQTSRALSTFIGSESYGAAFVGPANPGYCTAAALLGKNWNKPVASWACLNPDLHDGGYPTFLRPLPLSSQVLFAVLRYFRWAHAAIVTTDSDLWVETGHELATSLRHLGLPVSVVVTMETEGNGPSEALQRIKRADKVSPLFGTIYNSLLFVANAVERGRRSGRWVSGTSVAQHARGFEFDGFCQRLWVGEEGAGLQARFVVLDSDGSGSTLRPTHTLTPSTHGGSLVPTGRSMHFPGGSTPGTDSGCWFDSNTICSGGVDPVFVLLIFVLITGLAVGGVALAYFLRRRIQQSQLMKGPNKILLTLDDLVFINAQLSKKKMNEDSVTGRSLSDVKSNRTPRHSVSGRSLTAATPESSNVAIYEGDWVWLKKFPVGGKNMEIKPTTKTVFCKVSGQCREGGDCEQLTTPPPHLLMQAMKYLHHRDVVHGRLKSRNCVVDGRFVLKVTDYSYNEILDTQKMPHMEGRPEGERGPTSSPPDQLPSYIQAALSLTSPLSLTVSIISSSPIVETIGDAYMVASGVPNRNGNRHAAEISNMSLDILHCIGAFRMRHMPDVKVKIRIGLHSGEHARSCSRQGALLSGLGTHSTHPDTESPSCEAASTVCAQGRFLHLCACSLGHSCVLSSSAYRIHVNQSTVSILQSLEMGYRLEVRGKTELKVPGTAVNQYRSVS